jgi:hypothetical protein
MLKIEYVNDYNERTYNFVKCSNWIIVSYEPPEIVCGHIFYFCVRRGRVW